MTAPGNSTVLIVLLAAFVACAGYAAGRLHQWHRAGQDRDEAYRDGYDTATRSVFTMAARIIAPRRSGTIRASAHVLPAAAAGTPATTPAASRSSGGASSGRRRSRLASYRDNARTLPRTTPPAPPDPSPEEDTTLLPPPGGLAGDSVLLPPAAVSAGDPTLLPPPGVLAGDSVLLPPPGVLAGDTTLLPPPGLSGRHTLPDELVQAATYRLPADRVARAKVHEAERDAGSPDEETTRLPPVPRPRSS